ncbi:HAMP domain-containing methyl-accepting chemotaxis protein [Marinobacter sp. JSM 1782161]|uniref:HAMP domain-containing methyl-accepting chemotaxis protein n=1 Tax=Marinobacter sp. JSM 1782161 TaxID=2685906 RepID=UPI001403CD6A|nr:methyl-accepting chemotaxis protein [Marinobacter sp. JSM 1782161]
MRLLSFFTSLSIGRKLGIGFAVLIILSVIVGAIGLQALNSYTGRAVIVGQVSALETRLLEARLAEKSFLLEPTDANLEAAREQSAAARQVAESLETHLTAAADRQRLEQVKQGSTRYSQLLSDLAATSEARNQTVSQLETDARMTESRLSTEDKLYMAAAALKQMRRSERSFLVEANDDAIQQFESAADRALRSIKSSFVDKSVKQEITGLFEQYAKTFHSAVDQVRRTHELETAMVGAADAILDAAGGLKATQIPLMRRDHQQALVLIMATTAVVILLGIALAWGLSRNIVRPIREAVDVASCVASGDLRREIDSPRRDELGQLLGGLGSMVVSLRELVLGINNGSTEIAHSTGDLSSVTEQTRDGMTQQRDQTDQVATAMNEMAATVSEVARNAEEAFGAANRASETAAQGEAAVGETVTYVEELNTRSQGVMAQLETLRSDTQNIGTVLDVIKSVAEQTNLLALNAAIEAARAGEQGRGFAVVADEVRSLAQRTQSSAAEIETLISNLVSSAESSVQAMATGTELANRTLDSARTTGQTITAIGQAVEEIRQLNSQIATAAEQQSSVAEDINQNVTRIRDISDQSASSATQVASSSTELARLGETLRTQVARFSV